MHSMNLKILFVGIFIFISACGNHTENRVVEEKKGSFSDYWYAVKILKLNLVKKFNTGLYRYSVMESVFTPVDLVSYPNTLKLSSSIQEWCGHVYSQLNLEGNLYRVNQFSYFESEGDKFSFIEKTILEDELWTRIRINPDSLPTGEIKIIPSLLISRLKHEQTQVVKASATLSEIPETDQMEYKLSFPETNREFRVHFKKDFPHHIISWEEQYQSGFGEDVKTLVTRATRNKSIYSDYWNKNSINDVSLREELGIE